MNGKRHVKDVFNGKDSLDAIHDDDALYWKRRISAQGWKVKLPHGCNLIGAVLANQSREIFHMLLDKFPECVNAADTHGWRPLHVCAALNLSYDAAMLVEKNANINLCTSNGDTPLTLSERRDHADVSFVLRRALVGAQLHPNVSFSYLLGQCSKPLPPTDTPSPSNNRHHSPHTHTSRHPQASKLDIHRPPSLQLLQSPTALLCNTSRSSFSSNSSVKSVPPPTPQQFSSPQPSSGPGASASDGSPAPSMSDHHSPMGSNDNIDDTYTTPSPSQHNLTTAVTIALNSQQLPHLSSGSSANHRPSYAPPPSPRGLCQSPAPPGGEAHEERYEDTSSLPRSPYSDRSPNEDSDKNRILRPGGGGGSINRNNDNGNCANNPYGCTSAENPLSPDSSGGDSVLHIDPPPSPCNPSPCNSLPGQIQNLNMDDIDPNKPKYAALRGGGSLLSGGGGSSREQEEEKMRRRLSGESVQDSCVSQSLPVNTSFRKGSGLAIEQGIIGDKRGSAPSSSLVSRNSGGSAREFENENKARRLELHRKIMQSRLALRNTVKEIENNEATDLASARPPKNRGSFFGRRDSSPKKNSLPIRDPMQAIESMTRSSTSRGVTFSAQLTTHKIEIDPNKKFSRQSVPYFIMPKTKKPSHSVPTYKLSSDDIAARKIQRAYRARAFHWERVTGVGCGIFLKWTFCDRGAFVSKIQFHRPGDKRMDGATFTNSMLKGIGIKEGDRLLMINNIFVLALPKQALKRIWKEEDGAGPHACLVCLRRRELNEIPLYN